MEPEEIEKTLQAWGLRLAECIGTCFAMRAAVVALFNAHPQPAQALQSLRQVQSNSEAAIATLGPDVLAAFDLATAELTALLRNPPQT